MSAAAPAKLLVLDVDGTVLTSEHQTSAATRQAVEDLTGRGLRVVLASSRGPAGLRPIMSALGLSGFAVAYQGALVCRLASAPSAPAETVTETRIPLQAARMVRRLVQTQGLSVGWHSGEVWYVSEIDDAVRKEAGIIGQTPAVVDLEKLQEEPHKVLCVAGKPALVPNLHGLVETLPVECAGHFSHHNYLEITSCEANKASALRALGERLGKSLAEMAAIGDGENDVAMLREVGLGIAMGQATPVIKKLADWITESNDRDGIAVAVERLIRRMRANRLEAKTDAHEQRTMLPKGDPRWIANGLC